MTGGLEKAREATWFMKTTLPLSVWLIELRLTAEASTVLDGVQEAVDHRAEVRRVGVQERKPPLEARRVRVASQIPEILGQHEGAVERRTRELRAIHDLVAVSYTHLTLPTTPYV